MRIELRDWLTTVGIVVMLGVHFIAAAARHSDACQRLLPPNISLNHDLEHVLAKIYRASPRFRQQCDRIAMAPALSVWVTTDARIPLSCQAFTLFKRRGLALNANVHLPPSGMLMTRMVGHEFEHILEQLDGLDLPALAKMPGSGVYESAPEMYETKRAQRAGVFVEAEVLSARRAD